MEILAPGDLLRIPLPGTARSNVLTRGARNTLRADVPKISFSLVLQHRAAPVANARVIAEYPPCAPQEISSDDRGGLSLCIPLYITQVTLRIPHLNVTTTIEVGHMDPHDERSGIIARLFNLGYIPRSADPTTTVDDGTLMLAILAFQNDHALPPTGVVDTQTQETLSRLHGS